MATEPLFCPACSAVREGLEPCRCGCDTPPQPAPILRIEDKQWLARQLRDGVGMGEICRELDRDAATIRRAFRSHQGPRAHVAPAPAANDRGVYRRRNCALCRRRFSTSVTRRLLCILCFERADDGLNDPGDGGSTGDLTVINL